MLTKNEGHKIDAMQSRPPLKTILALVLALLLVGQMVAVKEAEKALGLINAESKEKRNGPD